VFNDKATSIIFNRDKLEAASLVLDQDYSVPEASRSLGINENVLRRWVNQLRDERLGTTPQGKTLPSRSPNL